MKLYKIIAIALVLALAISLTACGNNNNENNQNNTENSANNNTNNNDNDNENNVNTNNENNEEDTNNQNSSNDQTDESSYINTDSALPIVKDGEEVTLTAVTPFDEGLGVEAEDHWFWNYAEEFMNINFEVRQIVNSALDEQKSLMYASGEVPDIMLGMNMTTSEIVKYGQSEGQLLALNDYLNTDYAPHVVKWFEYDPTLKAVSTCPDGNIYTLPRIDAPNNPGGVGRIFTNQEWLEEVNMETPEELDDFIEMLREFKKLDSDIIPLAGGADQIDPRYYILLSLGFVTDDSMGLRPALREGEVEIPIGHELYYEYLKVMNTLYEEELIAQNFFTVDATQIRADAAEGKVGVIAEPAYLSMPDTYLDWWAVKPLKSEWNDKQLWKGPYNSRVGGFSISADCEYPEAAVRFGDFFFSDKGAQYSWGGPLADSEDTLDMIGGYYIDEEGNGVYPDIEEGKVEGVYAYLMNIAPCFPAVGNFSGFPFEYQEEQYRINYDFAGVEGVTRVLSEDNPDNHYRMGVIANLLPYAVDGYPNVVYFSEEQNTRIADLKTVLQDYSASETAKFITGARELNETEFDMYISELESLGIDEYKQIHADAYDDYMAALN